MASLVSATVVGLVLFRTLRQPQRQGSTPRCAQCDYNLTGLTTDRCPECGTELTGANVVHGELVRRPLSAVLAAAIATIAATLVVSQAVTFDWYRAYPTAWVFTDLQSSSPQVRSKAWRELHRRDSAGSLSQLGHSRLIDICLAEQVANRPDTEMIDHLGTWLLANRLSEKQRQIFFKQIVQLELVVRPSIAAGKSLPVEVRHCARGPSRPRLWISVKQDAPTVDGTPPRRWSNRRDTLMCDVEDKSHSQRIPPSAWESPIAAGKHRLTMMAHVEVMDGHPTKDHPTLLHQADIPLKQDFEVLAAEPPDYIRLIDDSSLKAALQNAIRPRDIQPASEPYPGVCLIMDCGNLPVGIAFDLQARVWGMERFIGSIHLAKGESNSILVWAKNLPSDGTFDLILRSSKTVAEDTVDLFEIWQGELVYPNLRVKPDKNVQASSKPAG
jgi:hypothetical protein